MIKEQIHYLGPSRLTDAEEHFFSELFTILQHADPDYRITIDKRPEEVIAHVQVSDPEFRQDVINNILHFNRLKLPYRIRFSSSLAISKLISFRVSEG